MKMALKYHLRHTVKPLIIFYLVILVFVILNTIGAASREGSASPSNGLNYCGLETATAIFLLVLGLNFFRENFLMFMQHSRSRSTLFVSGILAVLCLCAFTALIDSLLSLIASAAGSYTTVYMALFHQRYASLGATARVLESGLWHFCVYLVFSLTGLFITILYYRLNKALKLTVSIGVPVLLFIGLPYLWFRYDWNFRFFGLIDLIIKGVSGNYGMLPLLSAATFALLGIVIAGLCFVLQRGAVIKE